MERARKERSKGRGRKEADNLVPVELSSLPFLSFEENQKYRENLVAPYLELSELQKNPII